MTTTDLDALAAAARAADASIQEAVWGDVVAAVDRSYSELVAHQTLLEARNRELQALRKSMESVFMAASDVLLVMTREGQIEMASASLKDMTGRQDVSGQVAADLFDDPQAFRDLLNRVHLDRVAHQMDLSLTTPNGPAPLEVSLAPRIDGRRRVVGAVLTGRAVGELRRAYAELATSHDRLVAAQTQLVRSEKMASLGRLLAGVAHELNNPISFVYANTHALERYASRLETYFDRVSAGASRAELIALREDLKLDREMRNLRTAIDGARDGAERVRDIVADLRRLSAEGDGEMRPTDLVDLTRTAASWIERGGRSNILPVFEGEAVLMVNGRAGHLQQIVMNLIQNATDAVRDLPEPRITVRAHREGDRAYLDVADNGPGVPEEARAAIFDPFFTTKPVGQGTGLGLPISAKIAEEHGGRLLLVPTQTGATLRLDLPAEQDGQTQ